MSNVALFTGGNLALPEHLRGVEVDEQTKKLAGNGGGLRISIRGSVFRMMNNGEEVAKNDDRAMNVVIVRSSPDTARTFYAESFVEGEDAKPPTCWSSNGVEPEPDVKEKQSPKCATCPQNVAGSGQNGDSRACRFSRNLAVALEGDIGGKVYKLTLPAMSIFGKVENNVMPLQAYAKQLIAHNLPVNAVLTELRFDTSVSTPKLGFKAVRYLTKEEYEIAKAQGETPEAIEATKTTVYQADNAATTPPLAIAGTNPAAESKPAPAAAADVGGDNQPATVGNTATVPATQPVTQQRRRRSTASAEGNAPKESAQPAATHTTTSATGTSAPSPEPQAAQPAMTMPNGMAMTPEMMQQMMQMMAAMQGGGAVPAAAAEPVVKETKAAASPAPQGAAALLSQWDKEDEE